MLGGLVEEVTHLEELGVKENFFKNALNEEGHVDSLLAYHRERVAGFERERHDWLQRYEMVRPRPQDEHRREWDARQLKDAIGLLQKDLSDARQRLFEERQKILKAQAEQTQLKKKLQLDADVAETLLQNCKPSEQKLALTAGNKPAVVSKYVNNDLNLNFADKKDKLVGKSPKPLGVMKQNERIYSILGNGDGKKQAGTQLGKNTPVHMLADGNTQLHGDTESQRLLAEAELFNSQLSPEERELDRRKNQLSGVIKFLTEEYQEKERRYNLEVLDALAKIDNLSEGTLKNEKLICDLNKEVLKQRIAFEQRELELHHTNEALRRENVEYANALATTEIKLIGDKKAIQRGIDKECDKRSSKYRTRARESGEELEKLQRRYKELKEKHKEYTKGLEKQLLELKEKHSSTKRKKEMELTTTMRDWDAAAGAIQQQLQQLSLRTDLSAEERDLRITKLSEVFYTSQQRLEAILRPRRQASRRRGRSAGRRGKSSKKAKLASGGMGELEAQRQRLRYPEESGEQGGSEEELEGAEEAGEGFEEEGGEEEHGHTQEEDDIQPEDQVDPQENQGIGRPARPQSAAGGRR